MQELFYLTDNSVVGQMLKGNSHLRLSCLADLQYSGLCGGSDFILEQPLPHIWWKRWDSDFFLEERETQNSSASSTMNFREVLSDCFIVGYLFVPRTFACLSVTFFCNFRVHSVLFSVQASIFWTTFWGKS